jgi:hypothetical protein
MSVGLWVLAVALAAGTAGWKLGRVSAWTEASLALIRKDQVIDGLKAAQHHQGCLEVIGRQWRELDRLKEYADHLEGRLHGGEDLDRELRRLLEGGGAA